MWHPPIAWTPAAQKIGARTRKTRKFFVFLRARRPALLDADFPQTLAQSESVEPGGKAPVEPGLLALATLLQAYCHGGDREAVALTVLAKRGQWVLDCVGAEQPPCSPSSLCHFRMRLIAHDLDQRLLERTGARAEQTGGFGARPLRAALAATPRCGAGRVEAPLNRLGQARRTAGGRVAQELETSAAARLAAAGLALGGHSRLKAALARDWGAPTAREHALHLVLAEVGRWQRWREQQQRLSVHAPPRQEGLDPRPQLVTQATEPDPAGGPGARRIKKHGAPERRLSIEAQARRHGRKSSAKTFNGFQEHWLVALASTGTRAGVVRPANEPEPGVVDLGAEELTRPPGLLQLDIALGYRARPQIRQWAEQGVAISARPWPQAGALFTQDDFTLDVAHGPVPWPGGQLGPLVAGKNAQFPASACDACPQHTPCPKARSGQGRSLDIRADEQVQRTLRATIRPQRGRASRRKRTAVEQALSPPLAHPGRRARYKGLRKNQFDGRRQAAVSNLQVAAHYGEARQLAA